MDKKACFLVALLSCLGSLSMMSQSIDEHAVADKAMFELRKGMPDKTVAMNPVTDFDCPDPSIVKVGEWFYCFKTGYPIKIYRSRDLCNWTYYRDMFPGPSPHDPYGDGKLD
ncbi:MAG: family 43 glycosylhydrolase, partial [Bacteroidaceae bacterium]|nr:family 43 glycosylhydrolase [Bacteroidaceae bacterium]